MISIIIGVVLDFILGDPYSFPHPVKLMGKIIATEEKYIRKITQSEKGLKIGGFIVVIVNILLAFFLPYLLLKTIKKYKIIYFIVNTYIIYSCIAARCLHDEAMKVSYALDIGIKRS